MISLILPTGLQTKILLIIRTMEIFSLNGVNYKTICTSRNSFLKKEVVNKALKID